MNSFISLFSVFLFSLVSQPITFAARIHATLLFVPNTPSTLSLWSSKIHCFPYELYDFIILSQAKVQDHGEISFLSSENAIFQVNEFIDQAHEHNIKVLLSIGGKPELYDTTLGSIMMFPKEFLANLEQIVREFNFDGVNIDITYNPIERFMKEFAKSFKSSESTKDKLLTMINAPEPVFYSDTYDLYDYVIVRNFNTDKEVSLDPLVNYAGGRFYLFVKARKLVVAINFRKYGENEVEDPDATRLIKESLEKLDPEVVGGVLSWDSLYDSGSLNRECQWTGSEALAKVLFKTKDFREL